MTEKKPTSKTIHTVEGKTKKSKEERHAEATPKRLIACLFWVLGVACEVLAVLVLNKTIYVQNILLWLCVALVADLILVIIGSQFWKRANDIDPASEANKVKYFLQNQMGLIVSIIAFFPIVLLLINNKDLDNKTKKIVTAVAAVALVLCSLVSIDWNPISEEKYQQLSTELDGTPVYWTRYGKAYHLDTECSSLTRTTDLFEGTIEQAIEAGRSKPCHFCVGEE